MKFSAKTEQEANIGPLIATTLKEQVPIFGPNSYKNQKVIAELSAQVKGIVQQPGNYVIDLLDPAQSSQVEQSQHTASKLNGNSKQENGVVFTKDAKSDRRESVSAEPLSSAAQHDSEHYATRRALPTSKEQHNLLDKVMLRRAKKGYLFNSELNMSIVSEDRWLQDVWEWVSCKLL